jgi:hypothetical protein
MPVVVKPEQRGASPDAVGGGLGHTGWEIRGLGARSRGASRVAPIMHHESDVAACFHGLRADGDG